MRVNVHNMITDNIWISNKIVLYIKIIYRTILSTRKQFTYYNTYLLLIYDYSLCILVTSYFKVQIKTLSTSNIYTVFTCM